MPVGVAEVKASKFLSYFSHSGPYTGLIYLEWWATATADLNLWCISSNSTFL